MSSCHSVRAERRPPPVPPANRTHAPVVADGDTAVARVCSAVHHARRLLRVKIVPPDEVVRRDSQREPVIAGHAHRHNLNEY